MAITITQAKALVENEVKFETLEVSEIAEIAEVLAKSTAKGIETVIAKLVKRINDRKDVAPAEEISELATIENSIKTNTGAEVKVNEEAKNKVVKKFVPKKNVEKAEEVQAELPLEEEEVQVDDEALEEEAIHRALAIEINEIKTLAELRKFAGEYEVKIPKGAKLDKAKKFLKAETIGYDVLNEYELRTEVNTETEEKADEKVQYAEITLDEVTGYVQSKPYQVLAYVQEPGRSELTQFTVIFANTEIVVLLDMSNIINSVIKCERSTFQGDTMLLDNNECPVAFYAPKDK